MGRFAAARVSRRTPSDNAGRFMDTAARTPPVITVTIPVYNEEDNIAPLYERVRDALVALGRLWELILVNDGSKDATAERLDAVAAGDARVTVVHLRRNYGQTAALMAGLDHARG